MNVQEQYRQEYRRLKPGWKDSMTIYRAMIDRYVQGQTKILDIGCGHNDFLKPVYSKTPHTYGIDPDASALQKNRIIKHKFTGHAEKIPVENNLFDLVVSAWVLEHLENPQRVFREIHRVLKPGGHVIFLTPNVWNYNVWIIRSIPNRFHHFFTRRLYDRKEGDTYPVQYRINSVKKCTEILTPIGLKKTDLVLNGDPSYISFNKPLFKFACILEAFFEKYMSSAKVHLIGDYEK